MKTRAWNALEYIKTREDLIGFAQAYHEDIMNNPWQGMAYAPKDQILIAWISSDKGFQDITTNIYWSKPRECWCWEFDETPIKRPDLIQGWQTYPRPPGVMQ